VATVHDLTAAGLTPRQADHWTRKGWLRADNAECGSGRARTWPDGEVAIATLMVRLTSAGLFAEVAHQIARHRQFFGVPPGAESQVGLGVWLRIDPTP
jgi:hypothetical protein